MADYVSIDEFNSGWTFFTKYISGAASEGVGGIPNGKFPCSYYSCSGCDDWLDTDNTNRNVNYLRG